MRIMLIVSSPVIWSSVAARRRELLMTMDRVRNEGRGTNRSTRTTIKSGLSVLALGLLAAAVLYECGAFDRYASGVMTRPSGVSISNDDVQTLDAYAEELGSVMVRAQGPDPAEFARRVDGPGRGVETLVLSGSAFEEEGAQIVLRVRMQRDEQAGFWFE